MSRQSERSQSQRIANGSINVDPPKFEQSLISNSNDDKIDEDEEEKLEFIPPSVNGHQVC